MFIKIEPAGFFMHTVKLIFDLDNPDSEDVEVRDYLAKHELEPRYRWDDKLDDDEAEVIQFGGCYLGNHLQGIGQIQRKAVEIELLVEAVTPYVEKVFREVALDQVSDPKCITEGLLWLEILIMILVYFKCLRWFPKFFNCPQFML